MLKKKKWRAIIAVSLCLALIGGTIVYVGSKDTLKAKADSYEFDGSDSGEIEKTAPRDRQGLLSTITSLLGGLGKSGNGSIMDGSGSNSQMDQLNNSGLGSLSGLLGNGVVGKVLDMVSGGKIGMVKNLINKAMSLVKSPQRNNSRCSAKNDIVVSDIKEVKSQNGTIAYEVDYSNKDGNVPYGYSILKYDKKTGEFSVDESCVKEGQEDAQAMQN